MNYIYTLSDPTTNQVRYVGKTNFPRQRLLEHYKKRTKASYKSNWIKSLKNKGLTPVMDIIDVVGDDWRYWESYWISQFIAWGFSLTNHTGGGEGLSFANQTSFKKGHTPWNKGKGGYKSPKRKPIKQFTKQGKYIRTWECCQVAAEHYNCNMENIRNNISGRSKSAVGYVWTY